MKARNRNFVKQAERTLKKQFDEANDRVWKRMFALLDDDELEALIAYLGDEPPTAESEAVAKKIDKEFEKLEAANDADCRTIQQLKPLFWGAT